MQARVEKQAKAVRPELDEDSQWLVKEFLRLGYSSQKEVIREALEVLFQKKMEEEAQTWNSENSDLESLQLENT